MSKDKKAQQLGMNPSTASGRLVKDILFNLIDKHGEVCYHCGESMNRDDFSIEHIKPWLDSEAPKELFFDMDNIAFSHLKCNIKAGRRPRKGSRSHGVSGYNNGCRWTICTEASYEKCNRRRKRLKSLTGKDR